MIEILTIAACCWWFAEGSGLTNHIKWALFVFDIYYKKDLEGNKIPHDKLLPFDCTKCLSFWVGNMYFFDKHNLLHGLVMAILCSFFGIVISKILWQLR